MAAARKKITYLRDQVEIASEIEHAFTTYLGIHF